MIQEEVKKMKTVRSSYTVGVVCENQFKSNAVFEGRVREYETFLRKVPFSLGEKVTYQDEEVKIMSSEIVDGKVLIAKDLDQPAYEVDTSEVISQKAPLTSNMYYFGQIIGIENKKGIKYVFNPIKLLQNPQEVLTAEMIFKYENMIKKLMAEYNESRI
jgi:superfamily I DNA and RNA helicase